MGRHFLTLVECLLHVPVYTDLRLLLLLLLHLAGVRLDEDFGAARDAYSLMFFYHLVFTRDDPHSGLVFCFGVTKHSFHGATLL